MYKKEYERVFESKDENRRKTHDYKNLKNFRYQVDETKTEEDKTEKEEKNKTAQELPLRIKSKDELNELKDRLLGLKTINCKLVQINISMILAI